jgi:hypothetical protein
MSKVGLNLVEAPLDLAAAARLRACLILPFVGADVGFNYADLFALRPRDPAATSAVDHFLPPARWNEVPVVKFDGADEGMRVQGGGWGRSCG